MAVSSRPRTPSRSTATPSFQTPPIPTDENAAPQGQRRTSFSFLRRGKSVERLNSKRSVSGGKLQKKTSKSETPETPGVPDRAPRIPDLTTQPRLSTFGGDGAGDSATGTPRRHHNQAQMVVSRSSPYNVPIPQIPASPNAAEFDPYARTESMTNRGRYSYASSAVSTLNSPRRVRRRKDPTPFNILVIGARNSGKTSFIDFLRSSLTLPPRKQRPQPRTDDLDAPVQNRFSANFPSHYVETELSGERIGLTLWDSEGLERNIVDLQLREIIAFVDSKFEETLGEEIKVVRSPNVKDPHIHCVVLLLDPLNLNQTLSTARKAREAGQNGNFSNGKSYLRDISPETLSGLDENLDLQVLRSLQGKTTIIPVISKADTITVDHMMSLKRAVWKSLKEAKVDPFESLGLEDDGDDEGDDAEAIEDDEDEEYDLKGTPRSKKSKHSRHDSKRFNEADEDEFARQENAQLLHTETSHLDSASSSSGSSFNVTKSSQQRQGPANTHEPRSQTLPPSTPANSSNSTPHIPFSVLTPDPIVTPHQPIAGQTGRKFPWGFADPYDAEHCDFMRLRDAIFKEWFSELREASREVWYEEWRAQRLNINNGGRGVGQGRSQVDPRAARQGMVPMAMLGNNGLAGKTTSANHMGSRLPSGAMLSARASPNPQTMLIPVTTLDANEGEVGVAR